MSTLIKEDGKMAVLTYPGVYVEEVPSGVRPIEAAGTSTAAFFGVAERGPINEVRRIFNFTQFQNTYGGFLRDYYLAHAVYQFFNNGGTQCYVGRIASGAKTASVTIQDRTGKPRLKISASSPGLWGNHLQVLIESGEDADRKTNQFNLTVYRYRQGIDKRPTELEAFADLSMNPFSPSYVENVVNSRSRHIHVEVLKENLQWDAGYSESGEIEINGDILNDGQRKFRINIHGDGYRTIDLTDKLGGGNIDSLEAIRQAIENTIRPLEPYDPRLKEAFEGLSVTIDTIDANKQLRIISGLASPDSKIEILSALEETEDAAKPLKLGKRHKGTEVFGSSRMRPKDTPSDPESDDYYLLGDDEVEDAVSEVVPGDDGTLPPSENDYKDALHWLDTVRDVSLIAIPGVGLPNIADEGMNYCRGRSLSDCFFIADMANTDVTSENAEDFRDAINVPNSYGAVYFPWLKMTDPTGQSPEPIPAPPSGFVAGLYARIDASRGVWKAPAGTEAMLGGAVGLAAELTDQQHGNLNKDKNSVCVIRKFPGTGIVVWGARTLSSDPEYKYIPVRRMAIMLRVSIFSGIQWAVFEPNDEGLWSQLRLNIRSFMMTLFRQGAFQGATPREAFFVKCDSETTTQDDINLGIVNVLVGFAPLRPAEFVVVKISQKAGQAL
jgi:phage tail sheath protein FI